MKTSELDEMQDNAEAFIRWFRARFDVSICCVVTGYDVVVDEATAFHMFDGDIYAVKGALAETLGML